MKKKKKRKIKKQIRNLETISDKIFDLKNRPPDVIKSNEILSLAC